MALLRGLSRNVRPDWLRAPGRAPHAFVRAGNFASHDEASEPRADHDDLGVLTKAALVFPQCKEFGSYPGEDTRSMRLGQWGFPSDGNANFTFLPTVSGNSALPDTSGDAVQELANAYRHQRPRPQSGRRLRGF
jgi:hypothetical protein